MSEQVIGQWFIYLVLAVLVLEFLLRTLWFERALGLHRSSVWSLLAGGSLALALHSAWLDQGLAVLTLWLMLAGVCHIGQCVAPRR